MTHLIPAAVLAGVLSTTAFAAVDDNFNDNVTGPQWSVLTDHPSLTVTEQNNRLEVISAPSNSPINDALYLSNGSTPFRLSTASDFEIAIDYSFTQVRNEPALGSLLGVVFGVGRDLDGTDSAAIGYFYSRQNFGLPVTLGGVGVGHRTDDVSSEDAAALATTSGTFVIAYSAAGDDLSFKVDGGSTLYTLQNTVQAIWNASDLLVSFGARGHGFSTQSGDAYLDNFVVRSGTIITEPATLGLMGMATLALRRRRA
jgi:nitrogen fixation-related uncharacterized protein